MASTTTSATCGLTSPALADGKAPAARPQTPHCVGLPTLPPPPPRVAYLRTLSPLFTMNPTTSKGQKIARNVITMATGETPAEVATELPEIVKTMQEAWERLEDKYAVTSLAFAVAVALWSTSGMISAIDRLPIVPGVLELVGIGYTGWFAYRNLVFKPDREALIEKIKSTYSDIIGSS
ncbi:protein CURVATURE THYLAKOID 1B, chloroplastic [Phoenix dactylifera]|uniref:Protein CURVATURE THYLAKOID 1B, chloroplastic n=1 Tax=Phoenix dactylifera TaxID=42345 RepID=A0A8B7CEX3_PHODC|nr:protein CURVATURE THYLAKOID 1B, chloroplastic [Phoenix dactylifera]